jgi:hypothetical protein
MTKRSDDGYLEVSMAENPDAEGRFSVSVTQLVQGNIMARVTIKFASGDSTAYNYNSQDLFHQTYVCGRPPADRVVDIEITKGTRF